jgi:hypothetical protein
MLSASQPLVNASNQSSSNGLYQNTFLHFNKIHEARHEDRLRIGRRRLKQTSRRAEVGSFGEYCKSGNQMLLHLTEFQ